MNDLNALFDSVDGLKEDLIEYGTIAAGGVAGYYAAKLIKQYLPASVQQGALGRYAFPAAAFLAGIFGGRAVARYNRKIGLGLTVGLTMVGLTTLANGFGMKLPGLAGDEDYYGVAGLFGPVSIEDGVSGPVSIEDGVSGFGAAQVEEVSGFQAVLQ